VAELADAQASGACVRKDVGVQVPPRPQTDRPTRSLTDQRPSPHGYSIIEAPDMDAAVELAKGCPILTAGGSIEVAETVDI
jgi:hypothetical protein